MAAWKRLDTTWRRSDLMKSFFEAKKGYFCYLSGT
jgi:hypothetical protein